VERPIVLGHESAGEIVELGAGVSPDRLGERVAIEPGVPCRRCDACKAGRYNLCPFVQFMATPPTDGALAEYVVTPADFAHPLPASLPYVDGALVEPTAVAVHAVRLAGAEPGARCAVFGVGPVGLLLVQVLRAFGSEVVVSDPDVRRVELAARFGARTGDAHDVDIAFDVSGHPDAIGATIDAVRRGGRVVWVGLPVADTIPVPVSTIIDKEIELHGVFRYANAHSLAIDLIASGKVRTEFLVSHRFPLAKTADALAMVADRSHGVVKAVIEPTVSNQAGKEA
jgi:L-iditol 2-dehydrogenase